MGTQKPNSQSGNSPREFNSGKDGLVNPADRQSSANLDTFQSSDRSSSKRSERNERSEERQNRGDRMTNDRSNAIR